MSHFSFMQSHGHSRECGIIPYIKQYIKFTFFIDSQTLVSASAGSESVDGNKYRCYTLTCSQYTSVNQV